jgi:hypothetical protein
MPTQVDNIDTRFREGRPGRQDARCGLANLGILGENHTQTGRIWSSYRWEARPYDHQDA